MTFAGEKALPARFGTAPGAGEMLNIHDLKAAYEQAIGHSTSNSTIYNLLVRHGWPTLMPRSFRPKRHLATENDFKKAAFHAHKAGSTIGGPGRSTAADHVRR